MRRQTFLKYQQIYLDFIQFRSQTGCSQKEFCRQTGVLPMTLSRAFALQRDGKVDYTLPFPGDNDIISQVPYASIHKSMPKEAPMEFVELVL